MMGVSACVSVSSIKALWEGRIRGRKEKEHRWRMARGGVTGRSDSTHSYEIFFIGEEIERMICDYVDS